MNPPSILIVEDEVVVAMDLRGELEAMGYAVAGVADTADQAIDQALRLRPDLVLMDVMLKGNKGDGIDVAERLRRELDTPIIFLTSFSDPETVARAARTAAYGYLTKPFQPRELRAGIEVALWKAKLEGQLRESDRWFASTLRCVQDAIVVVEADGKIRFINSAAEGLTGYSLEDAVGRPVGEVVRFTNQGQAIPSLVLRALELGRVVGVRYAQPFINRDGDAVPVDESAGPVRDERGNDLGAVLVLRNASDRIRHETLLRASQERFRSAFEFAPLGMAMVSLGGRFLQVNDALCRLLGCTPPWLLARTQVDVTHPSDVAHEEVRLADLRASEHAVTQFEKRYLRAADHEALWVLVNASLLIEHDEETCYLYQVHDLTAQKLAAAQLAELATERVKREASELADRSKTQFLSRVSHEMRTPLNAVLGFAELLKMQHAAGQPMSGAYSDHIFKAGKHLLALVDDVLDLQRAGDGTLNLNIGTVVLHEALPATIDLLSPLAESRSVRLEVSLPPGLHVSADPTRLSQIVLNIGSNAIKYNRPGGSVRFVAEAADPGWVRVTVQDTGIGMSDGQVEHLFEPFNRLGQEATNVPGVGLGLVITRGLVEAMGGALTVRSRPGHGTVVTLEFAQSTA